MALAKLTNKLANELEEAYDIINKTNLVIFKWTLSEAIPTDFVSDNISQFGYTPDDFYTGDLRDYWDFVHPEDRDRVKAELYWAREHGKHNYKNQYRIVCKNGDVRWVEEWVIHERDSFGKLMFEKGILKDITESVLISHKLQESEERYKELFDNASAMIITFNESGRITSYNHSFSKLMALNDFDKKRPLYIQNFLSEKAIDDIGTDDIFTYCMARIGKQIEVEMKRCDGQVRFLELNNRIIYKNNQIFEMQSVGNDVTEKKQAQEKIQYLTQHDSLTGLYNRLYFDECMSFLEKNERRGLAIIVGDVNGLKMVNDAFGHKMGDQLLIEIAKILRHIFSHPDDIISRLSGDEFAIITQSRNIEQLITRIQESCKELVQFPFLVDISMGYAIRKKMSQSMDSVFREADHAMYRNKLRRSKNIKLMMIESLKQQLNMILSESSTHSDRMVGFAEKIGRQIGLSDSAIEELVMSTSMHDIGMVSVNGAILNKAGKLEADEFNEIMKHCEIGYHLLIATPSLAGIGENVLAHHEHFDGSGYPQGLKGKEIPLISRIISVVDGYDAMTTPRVYREVISHNEAIEDIKQNSGIKYDPEVVNAFISIF